MCLKLNDLNPKKLFPRYPFAKAFTTSPWLPTYAFTFYRLIIGLYCLAWLMYSGYHYQTQWLLYISNWVFIFIVFHFILGSILSILYTLSDEAHKYESSPSAKWGSEPFIEGFSGYDEDNSGRSSLEGVEDPDDQLTLSYKILWVIFTIASVGALQSTIIYWSVFYENQGITSVNVTFLILNSFFITVELLISNLPVIVLHFFYSHFLQSIYVLFTVFYWMFGGTDEKGHRYIYKAFDYENEPAWAFLFVFLYMVIFQFIAQMYCFALFHLRKWLVRQFR